MASLPPIKWPTGRTPAKVEIFAYQHTGGRVALHVVELDTRLTYPAFLLEDMTGHWSSAEGWRSNPFLWVKGNEGDTRILHFKGNPSTWEGVWQTQNKVRDVKALPAFANTYNDGIDRKSDEPIVSFTYEQASQDRGPLEDIKTADTLNIPYTFYKKWSEARAYYLAEYDEYVGMTPKPGGNATVAHKEFWTKLCQKQKGGEAILPYTPVAMSLDERYLLLRDMPLADRQDLKGLLSFKKGTPVETRADYIAKRWEVADPRTGRLLGFDQIRVEVSPIGKTAVVYVAPFDMTFIMPNMPALDKEIYRNLKEIVALVKARNPNLDVTYPQGAYTSPASFPLRRVTNPHWIVLSRNFNALNAPDLTARRSRTMTLSEWARAN
mgnify:CR=1 FL=1|jgi:hypothetical protein